MKKLALFTALTVIGICNANAQSSVTLYGRVASGLDFVTNVATNGQSKNNFRFGSNQYGYSWFGLKGDEDLGGGVHAVFKLESLFSSGNGQIFTNELFIRDAYVGLAHERYGSIWFGEAMSLADETGWNIDPLGGQVGTGIPTFPFVRAWGPVSNSLPHTPPTRSRSSSTLTN